MEGDVNPEVKYAGLLRQEHILVLAEDGGLLDYTLVLQRVRKLLAQGRKREAFTILREIAVEVNASRWREKNVKNAKTPR